MPEHIARKSLFHRHLRRIEPKFGTIVVLLGGAARTGKRHPSPISCPILAKAGNFLLRKTVIQLCAGLRQTRRLSWDIDSEL
jgi:hypothetical protein